MLPRMNDAFEAFIAPARENRSAWMLVLGLCLLVLFYTEFTFFIMFLFSLFKAEGFNGVSTAWNTLGLELTQPRTPQDMIILLSTFVGMFAAISLSVIVLRDKSPMSLVGHGPVLRNMFTAIVLLFALSLVSAMVLYLYLDLNANIPFRIWLQWMPVALPLLLVQVSAEEFIFRGFLQQELAARFNSPLIWMVLPSIMFGALHWDFGKYGSNAWLIVASTSLFGLFAADVTARTGNLGAAIGLHFTNNFFAMMITALDGSLTGLSLYVTPFTASDTDTLRRLLLVDVGFMLFAYLTYLGVIHLKRRR